MKKIIISALFTLSLFATYAKGKEVLPKHEMRAAWIATVANIDWPSRAGLSVEQQQKEMIDLLDVLKETGMNTVVFQIRPATDAMYASPYEPWSQWLNGQQGKAPNPYYDPLEFIIDQCHKRGLEFHAWMNPYRAVFNFMSTKVSASHITKRHPEWFVNYGKHTYFNPGLQETRDYVASVVSDVVRRYDVDAIHFDDYFYPYKIAGEEFPDGGAFRKHPRGYPQNQKEAWRRNNVDLIIKQLHDSIKSVKPYVKFGISPFGVWRNKDKDPEGSASKAGQTNYDDLYANILKWLNEDWIDYVTPQIYWHIGFKIADYKVLANWWNEYTYGKNLYIGHGVYRLDKESKNPEWRSSQQLVDQVKLNRALGNVGGSMFYSAKWFRSDVLNVRETLKNNVYQQWAIVPENASIPRVEATAPQNFFIDKEGESLTFTWENEDHNTLSKPRYYILYRVRGSAKKSVRKTKNIMQVTTADNMQFKVVKKFLSSRKRFCVTAVNRLNIESKPSNVFGIRF
ncbi:glycoside hydrolase family 10 protein [Puteibacter caeruleilacunae]|nr:glycoside hydrolase family 10 protein [Puteibacter caeruleilacunae]